MMFSDFCVREDHIDAPLYTGVGPSASWEPGSLAYDYAEMKKVDSAVAMSYVEALFKNDWYFDEEDGKWKGCPKGGPPSMRPGLPNASGVSVHATWKQHEFGFGPYATTQRRFASIDKDVRRARATFDDAIRTGVELTNPFSDPEIVALVGLLRRFLDDEPAYRSDPVDPSVVLRLLRFMNLRDHKEAAFAYHMTSQLQRGARVCTTNLQVRVAPGTHSCLCFTDGHFRACP